MTNNIITSNINYNDLLNDDSDDSNENTEVDTCLISLEPLTKYNIKLSCNHTFNYKPLFLEIKKQKTVVNPLETMRLSTFQIKCPYCRHVQNNLLPFIPSQVNSKIYGVNYPAKYCFYLNKCEYVFKSGKRKNTMCGIKCNDKYCNKHINKENVKNKTISTCSAILKSGKNKGQICGCKCFKDNMCKRHYNLINKEDKNI